MQPDGGTENRALADPVDEACDQRSRHGVDQREDRGDGTRHAVAAGAPGDEQDDPERHHRDRHPGHERRNREPEPAGVESRFAVGPKHGRTLRQGPDGTRPECRRMLPMSADTSPYDALLLVSFGGPEGPDDVLPFLENVTRGRDIPRERLLEVGEHYLAFGGVSPINAQNRALVAALKADFAARGLRPAGLLGQPQLGALPGRHDGRDGRRRCAPSARPAHLGLLVVLRLPAVPREPGRCRRRRWGSGRRSWTGSGTTSTIPASSRRWSRTPWQRSPPSPPLRGPARTWCS